MLSLYDHNEEFQAALNVAFASLEESPNSMVSIISKEIKSIERSDRFIDYYESSDFASQLDQILSYIDDLEKKSPSDAFHVMLEFLDLHESVLNRCDDSLGSISGSFSLGAEQLGTLLESTYMSVYELVEFIFTRITHDPFHIYNRLIVHAKDALKKEGLSLLKNKLESGLSWSVLNRKNSSLIFSMAS